MTEQIEMPPAEEPQDWYFTWGHGQTLPDGTDAYNCYALIRGTYDSTRNEMFARFGQAWSWQYPEDKGYATTRDYCMKPVYITRFPKRFEDDGVTPLPAPSGRCGESVPQAGGAL